MWDYDKFFVEGNVIGIGEDGREVAIIQLGKLNTPYIKKCFSNITLTDNHRYIKYIIKLDSSGNLVEKIFDRERDVNLNPPPKFTHGMFIRIKYKADEDTVLGYVDTIRNLIIYQDGTCDNLKSGIEWINYDLIEVYDSSTVCFKQCNDIEPIWKRFK